MTGEERMNIARGLDFYSLRTLMEEQGMYIIIRASHSELLQEVNAQLSESYMQYKEKISERDKDGIVREAVCHLQDSLLDSGDYVSCLQESVSCAMGNYFTSMGYPFGEDSEDDNSLDEEDE